MMFQRKCLKRKQQVQNVIIIVRVLITFLHTKNSLLSHVAVYQYPGLFMKAHSPSKLKYLVWVSSTHFHDENMLISPTQESWLAEPLRFFRSFISEATKSCPELLRQYLLALNNVIFSFTWMISFTSPGTAYGAPVVRKLRSLNISMLRQCLTRTNTMLN